MGVDLKVILEQRKQVMETWLTRGEAARQLGKSLRTLDTFRELMRKDEDYVYLGRPAKIYYNPATIATWAERLSHDHED